MKLAIVTGLAVALVASGAQGADYRTLRRLQAAAPRVVQPLPAGIQVRPVEFARIVIHPKDGEAWALAYNSRTIPTIRIPPEGDTMLTWQGGRLDGQTASFARVFDRELATAGFAGGGSQSLFDDADGAADFKVAVLVDDIQGRFCIDCPHPLNPTGVPATVLMTAHWEIYSNLERKVVARITTSGGFNSKERLNDSVVPAILDAFGENTRLLLASEEFRRVVTGAGPGPSASAAAPAALTPIALRPAAPGKRTIASASESVAAILTGDGHGSGFLVSQDGYLLTNQHVVGGAKYVKVRWADRSESLGEVVRVDRRRDVALIKVDATGRKPLALRTGQPGVGDTVFAIGTPLDEKFQGTVTRGIVSASRTYEGQPFIQSDVVINGGNSGGPLLDENGAVVAVTVSSYQRGDIPSGLNLFIPISEALKALALQPVS
ncbi:S1C family serine protease [Phenylobacterium sp.]|uniref:S1C family serine protease n=1 Tax=Phenylobacterium sp. TaxID=1871053 RepID=UPI0035ADDD1A